MPDEVSDAVVKRDAHVFLWLRDRIMPQLSISCCHISIDF